MPSSDEEEHPFVKYGTPLTEIDDTQETSQKPIAIHEQIVTDAEGRRRFHGAFTGGFSAGYYNTVSTKDGWTPSTFRSSRSERNEKRSMQPEDFMDEEDMSEFGIAPQKIVTQSSFSNSNANRKTGMIEKFSANGTMLLGRDMLQALIIPVSNNIGIKLLQKMGWKPGQGIGPKVKRRKLKDQNYIPEDMTFAPQDTVPMDFAVKDNIHGLGYSGMDPKLALHDKINKSSAISLRTKTGTKLSFAGQAFGVGAYEEEDKDIYAQDSMANYDLVMEDEKQDISYGWSKPTKAIRGKEDLTAISYVRKILEAFKKAEQRVRRKMYPAPKLPQDFDPNKRLKLLQESKRLKHLAKNAIPTNISSSLDEGSKYNRLNPDQRGNLLGEKEVKLGTDENSVKSVFSLLSPQDRRRLELAKFNIPPKNQKGTPGVYEPFSSDSLKHSRYMQYLAALKERKNDPYSHIEHDPHMTEWEKHQEQEEFSKSSRFFQPLSATMSSRFAPESQELKDQDEKEKALKNAAKMKMFGVMTRESVEWHPDSLLCKRFNVPNPYLNSDIVGIPNMGSKYSSKEMFLDPSDFQKKANQSESKNSKLPIENDKESVYSGRIVRDTRNPKGKRNEQHSNKSRWDKEPVYQGASERNQTEVQEISAPSHQQAAKIERDIAEEDSIDQKSERPSMELFKAIFENLSDEDSTSEDEEMSTEIDISKNASQGTTESENIITNSNPQTDDLSRDFSEINPSDNLTTEKESQRHKFCLKPKCDSKATLLHNTSTLPTSHVISDEFGPALPPPSKISKLWKSIDPASLTGSSAKKKHKKYKHKTKKKSKKHKK